MKPTQSNSAPSQLYPNILRLSEKGEWRGGGEYTLDVIREVLVRLGNPQDDYKTIHVTGTNGKGSVCACLCALASQSPRWKRIGLFSSPHLSVPNERIRLDGKAISDELFDHYLGVVFEAVDLIGTSLSYFETVCAAAFVCFQHESVDLAVIEVGLGGMKDATNVLKAPLACAIASIGLDHEAILGEGKEAIARDKAQIIRPAAEVVAGNLGDPEYGEVCRVSKEVQAAKPSRLGDDFSVELLSSKAGYERGVYRSSGLELEFELSLLGRHQLENAGVALHIMELLGEELRSIRGGLRDVKWPARLESHQVDGREVILDCAHNPQGIEVVVEFLRRRGISPENRIEVVFGALETKRWEEMVEMLAPMAKLVHLIRPSSTRALETGFLVDKLSSFGVSTRDFGEDYGALIEYIEHSGNSRLEGGAGCVEPLLVLGSMYMVGEVRGRLKFPELAIW